MAVKYADPSIGDKARMLQSAGEIKVRVMHKSTKKQSPTSGTVQPIEGGKGFKGGKGSKSSKGGKADKGETICKFDGYCT